MSFWTDVIAYSPTWVDVYPETVRRFIATVAGGPMPPSVVRVSEPELACYGVHDVNGQARKAAANPDLDALYRKLAVQAKRAEELDSEATGEYDPPSWTDDSDEHVGPCLCVEGSASKICQVLASAAKVPFAELELSGLTAEKGIAKALSLGSEGSYLDLSELNLEVGPDFATFLDDPPQFAGWLRLTVCGEGQPYPLTKQQLIERARTCEPLQRVVNHAGQCFGVNQWEWTVSCRG